MKHREIFYEDDVCEGNKKRQQQRHALDSASTLAPWSNKYEAISIWFFFAAICNVV